MKIRLIESLNNSGTLYHGGFLDIRSVHNSEPLYLCPKTELTYYGYGRKKYKVEYSVKNPLVIDCKGNSFSHIPLDVFGESGFAKTDKIVWDVKEAGYYDSVIFNNVRDVNLTDEIALLYPEDQIKNITEINNNQSL